jgi:hypothetical protein
MVRRTWVTTAVALLLAAGLAVAVSGGTRHDPFGAVPDPLPLFLSTEEFFTDDYIDSGCILNSCTGSCIQYDAGYRCSGRAIYERWGYSGPEQKAPLPIQVDVAITCWVFVFYLQECTASDSETGSGRVTAYDYCWIYQLFSGSSGYSGGCACTEL